MRAEATNKSPAACETAKRISCPSTFLRCLALALRSEIPREPSPLLAALCEECRADVIEERFGRERCAACGYVNPCARVGGYEIIHSREIPVQVRRMSQPWQDYFARMVEVGRYAGEGRMVASHWAYTVLMQRRRAAEKKVQEGA